MIKMKPKKIICILLAVLSAALFVLPVFAQEAEDEPCEHVWQWVVDTEPTCVAGSKHLRCANCGEDAMGSTPIDPVQDHVWKMTAYQAPDGCKDGYYRYTCETCGATKEQFLPAPADHQWVWVVDVSPSRYVNGKQHQVCSVCGAVQNQNTLIPVEKDGGDAGNWILNWIDTVGNFFRNIVMQVIDFFNGIHF